MPCLARFGLAKPRPGTDVSDHFFDALRVKIRDAESGMVKNKAVYVALGVTREGEREVLGLWSPTMKGPNSGSR